MISFFILVFRANSLNPWRISPLRNAHHDATRSGIFGNLGGAGTNGFTYGQQSGLTQIRSAYR
jgi:hypothetical protein